MTYHHGALRTQVMQEALAVIEASGPGAVSLRDLARRAGVSHAAPAHHFGDRTGLLTAIAADGFDLLADALEAAGRTGGLVELGVAYVEFALAHPAHFAVMFQPALVRTDDEALTAAGARARGLLHAAAEPAGASGGTRSLAAWSIVHGFATLWLSGNVQRPDAEPAALAREVAELLAGEATPSA